LSRKFVVLLTCFGKIIGLDERKETLAYLEELKL